MNAKGEPGRRRSGRRGAAAESPEEALARARLHARKAVAEAMEALRALLDAGSLAVSGAPSAANRWLAPAARALEGLAADLDAPGAGHDSLLAAVASGLDAEIARWEDRAKNDPDARAVLRAFLGLRELLWELGVRGGDDAPEAQSDPASPPQPQRAAGVRKKTAKRGSARVQRVRVEG